LGLGTFCSWDVMGLGRFIGGTLCSGTFCGWDVFGLGRFVGAPVFNLFLVFSARNGVEFNFARTDFKNGGLRLSKFAEDIRPTIIHLLCILNLYRAKISDHQTSQDPDFYGAKTDLVEVIFFSFERSAPPCAVRANFL
jgi:hypothetical protein